MVPSETIFLSLKQLWILVSAFLLFMLWTSSCTQWNGKKYTKSMTNIIFESKFGLSVWLTGCFVILCIGVGAAVTWFTRQKYVSTEPWHCHHISAMVPMNSDFTAHKYETQVTGTSNHDWFVLPFPWNSSLCSMKLHKTTLCKIH